MAKTTSTTSRRAGAKRADRPGFSLIEGMISSVILAVSVVGVTGTILSSMSHDEFSAQQSAAIRSGSQAMDELASLPLDAGSASQVGLMDFADFADTTNAEVAQAIVPAMAATKAATTQPANVVAQTLDEVTDLLGVTSGTSSALATTTTVATTQPTRTSTASRKVTIDRRATLNGTTSTTGDFALVTVTVQADNGQTYKIKRLVTSAEAKSNAQ